MPRRGATSYESSLRRRTRHFFEDEHDDEDDFQTAPS